MFEIPVGRVLECGWCERVVVEDEHAIRYDFGTWGKHACSRLRLVRGGAA